MDTSRLIGITCALIAAILVIMAAKSCTEDSMKKNAANKATQDSGFNIIYPGENGNPPIQGTPAEGTSPEAAEYDGFGNPIIATEPPVTDIFGNVIEPTAPAEQPDQQYETVTDVFGNPIGTIPAETPAETTEGATTATLPFYEQYQEDLKHPNKYSGFYHGNENNEEHERPDAPPATIPPDFVIIIN